MEKREDMMIKWFMPAKGVKNITGADCTITLHSGGKGKGRAINLIIRKKSFVEGAKRCVIGFDGKRIYIKRAEFSDPKSYKCTRQTGNQNVVTIKSRNEDMVNALKPYVGDYNMRWDDSNLCYVIDLPVREERYV